MNAASQVPSGVLISTPVSTMSSEVAADTAVAARPAVTDKPTKSRRAMSPELLLSFVGFELLPDMAPPLRNVSFSRPAFGFKSGLGRHHGFGDTALAVGVDDLHIQLAPFGRFRCAHRR